jgi:hypothetical protein
VVISEVDAHLIPEPAAAIALDSYLARRRSSGHGASSRIANSWGIAMSGLRITLALVLSISAVVGGVVAVRWSSESPRLAVDALQRSSPPPSGAFARGGQPEPGGPALERALTIDAPDMMIALDSWARAERAHPATRADAEAAIADARSRALAPDVLADLGPEAALKFEDLLDAAKAAVAGARESADRLFGAVGAFDDALAAANLGWFIDADVLENVSERRRLTLLYFFAVERVAIVQVGSKTVRVLEVRRKDRLNWKHTLLGFTGSHLSYALVLLDQVDEQLVQSVLPGLGDDRAVGLFDENDDELPASASRVRARAGKIVRAEYGGASGVHPKVSARLGTLLARRRALFAGWQKLAAIRGFILETPTTLHADHDYSKALRGLVPDWELAELRAIEDRLSAPDIDRAYEALRDMFVASVRRHEVQHQLDLAGARARCRRPSDGTSARPS